MSIIDALLNLAGLLLWFNWRSMRLAKNRRALPLSLLSTLHLPENRRVPAWPYILGLFGLLVMRSFFYWQIGSAINWFPQLHLGAVVLTFRSDFWLRMGLFSLLSFAKILAGFYFCLLLLSAVNRSLGDRDAWHRLVRAHLGWLDKWPAVLKLLLPGCLGAVFWTALSPLFVKLGLLPSPISNLHLLQQTAFLAVSAYLAWQWLILILLGIHFINTYVYLGQFAVWTFVNTSALNLLLPLRWLPLRLGKFDLAPLLALALVAGLCHIAFSTLPDLFLSLPW